MKTKKDIVVPFSFVGGPQGPVWPPLIRPLGINLFTLNLVEISNIPQTFYYTFEIALDKESMLVRTRVILKINFALF